MQEDLITFDIEWLSLPKGEFRLLVMIADIGGDIKCLSNACRYFGLRDDETSTKDKMKEDLQSLADKGIINLTKIKRRYYATLNPIAEDNIITIKREYLKTIMLVAELNLLNPIVSSNIKRTVSLPLILTILHNLSASKT